MVAEPREGVVLGEDRDRSVGLGVLERQRRLAGEQLDKLELGLAEVRLLGRPSAQR